MLLLLCCCFLTLALAFLGTCAFSLQLPWSLSSWFCRGRGRHCLGWGTSRLALKDFLRPYLSQFLHFFGCLVSWLRACVLKCFAFLVGFSFHLCESSFVPFISQPFSLSIIPWNRWGLRGRRWSRIWLPWHMDRDFERGKLKLGQFKDIKPI